MGMTKGKLAAVLLGLTLCLAGGGVRAYQTLAGNVVESPQPAPKVTREQVEASGQPGAAARVDCYGDPLPARALARMGTTRLWRRQGWSQDKNALAFSPDGKTLATPINGMTVCLWDVATGKEMRRLITKDVKGRIASLGFSPDGKTLIAMNRELTVLRWEVATGKFLRKQEYQGPNRENVQFGGAAFLPDGQMLCLTDLLHAIEKKELRREYVWEAATGKEICQLSRSLKEGEGRRGNTAFSPDGKLLATVANEANNTKATNSVWEVATGKEIRQLTYEEGLVGVVAFSRDGKTLAAAVNDEKISDNDEEICVWEISTGKKIHQIQAKGAYGGPLAYSRDGKTLVGGEAGHLWDLATGKEIRSFGCEDAKVAFFSPDGKTLAMGDGAGAIRLWEVATGKEVGPRKGYRGGIRSVTYSPDGKTLASMGEDETVRLWEAATGKEMRSLAKNPHRGRGAIAYSPDGKMLVSMDDEDLHLWDTATGKEIRRLGEGGSPESAAFSPDGKRLAAIISYDRMVSVWEVATGKEIYSRPARQEAAGSDISLAFSPDGRLLAVPCNGNTVLLWEAATGKLIDFLGGQKGAARDKTRFIVSLAFSPDSRMLATSSGWDDKIHVWEVLSGKEIGGQLWQLDGLKSDRDGYTLAFSPDGRILASAARGTDGNGNFDPKVHLWELSSGKETGRLTGHQASVQTLAFSPDGKTLASGSKDLTCLVWDLTSVTRLKPMPAQPLSPERLESAWADLAQDPAKAYAAIWALQAASAQAVPLLRARVQSVAPLTDSQQLTRWIADLGAESSLVRKKAQREIMKLREAAVPALRQALQGQPVLEVKQRLQALLGELDSKLIVVSPDRLRELRAVQVLESIGTTEAQQVLQAWAKGVAGARLTVEAQAALARLTKRSAAKP